MVPTRNVQYELDATMIDTLSWIRAVDVWDFKFEI
jgi:hypothetical protein